MCQPIHNLLSRSAIKSPLRGHIPSCRGGKFFEQKLKFGQLERLWLYREQCFFSFSCSYVDLILNIMDKAGVLGNVSYQESIAFSSKMFFLFWMRMMFPQWSPRPLCIVRQSREILSPGFYILYVLRTNRSICRGGSFHKLPPNPAEQCFASRGEPFCSRNPSTTML